jgi:hypothetical protein
MRMFDVQGIEIRAPRGKLFEFPRDPGNLRRWARAFTSAEEGRARLETPAGAVDVHLDVSADAGAGTMDWRLEFPDGSVGLAQSRVTETTRGTCIYSFVLHAAAGCPRAGRGRARGSARDPAFRARDSEVTDGTAMRPPTTLEDVARRAVDGDRDALDVLVIRRSISHVVWPERSTRGVTELSERRDRGHQDCPCDCPCGAPKQGLQSERQPNRLFGEAKETEGFTRKIEGYREADFRLANHRLQPLGHLTAAKKLSRNEIATYTPRRLSPRLSLKLSLTAFRAEAERAQRTRPER